MSKNETYYYVDTNILIYLGAIENLNAIGVDDEELRTIMVGKLSGREHDVDGLLILYDKVKNNEIKLIATPTVIFETVKPLLFNRKTGANFDFMKKYCITKMPSKEKAEEYAMAVARLGENYHNNRLFTHLPKDQLDQDIMAEVSIDKNAKFLSIDKFNLTHISMQLANRLNLVFDPTMSDEERYTQTIHIKNEFLKELLSSPEYAGALKERPEFIKQLFLTTNVKEYINPKHGRFRAPEIIAIENAKFNEKETKPILPGDEFKKDDESGNENAKVENAILRTHSEELRMMEENQRKKQEKKKKEKEKESEEEIFGMGL